MEKECITVKNLTLAYDLKPVVFDLSFSIQKGMMVAIIGPNGAGKSTVLKGMLGLVKPISGVIEYFGKPFSTYKKNITYVPQKETVDWSFPMTVFEAVMMGRYGKLGWFKTPKSLDRKVVTSALAQVGLLELKNHQIAELSGGQQQRVFLARALASEAEVFFLDEPFQGVDIYSEQTIVQVLKRLHAQGKTIIAVHHNLQTARDYFSDIMLLNVGLIAFGKAQDVLTQENINRTYRK
ncbi:MAG TPA: metal ABC transporter ATP-binding protein [Bacilli bacterium]|nr:metal ABC transporter ATP-binding protein [Bacilli bacterium]